MACMAFYNLSPTSHSCHFPTHPAYNGLHIHNHKAILTPNKINNQSLMSSNN